MLQLTFDPLLTPEAFAGAMDLFDGRSMTASCARWDEAASQWTVAGITHIGVTWPDPASAAAASTSPAGGKATATVTCSVTKLGLYAVVEVPVGCDGLVKGTLTRDLCGVCGGDNGTCSGCDGAPNSGRNKACGGHGHCAGRNCVCEDGYFGVVCQASKEKSII